MLRRIHLPLLLFNIAAAPLLAQVPTPALMPNLPSSYTQRVIGTYSYTINSNGDRVQTGGDRLYEFVAFHTVVDASGNLVMIDFSVSPIAVYSVTPEGGKTKLFEVPNMAQCTQQGNATVRETQFIASNGVGFFGSGNASKKGD